MAKKSGNTYYPQPGENRRGISYDEGRTYTPTHPSASDIPLGSGMLDEAAKALRHTRESGMGADKHHKD